MRGIRTDDAFRLICREFPDAGNVRIMQARKSGHWLKLDEPHGYPLRELGNLYTAKYEAVGLRLLDRNRRLSFPDYELDEFVKEFHWEPGDWLDVDVNQGMREAMVIAVDGDEALIEYEMPAGTSALWVIDRHNPVGWKLRGMSYCNITQRWKRAIVEGGKELLANPQKPLDKETRDWLESLKN